MAKLDTWRVDAPAWVPCVQCGRRVLQALTPDGQHVWLDVHVQTWCVLWQTGEALPRAQCSRAYPLHTCRPLSEG